MNRRNKIVIFGAAFIAVIILYFGLFHNDKKRFDWSEDYVLDKEKPFGTWLVSELLKEYDKDRVFKKLSSPLDQSLKNAKIPSNFIFIGQEIYLENNSVDSLLSFVSGGNNAFIFTSSDPELLLHKIVEASLDDSIYFHSDAFYGDSTIAYFDTNLDGKKVDYLVPYTNRWGKSNDWNYLDHAPSLSSFKKLGSFEAFNEKGESVEGINFYKIKYNKGTFYFHTQAVIFTNNVLKEGSMLAYTNRVFSYLNDGPILWEEHNWRFNQPNKKTWLFKPNYYQTGQSPLKFIFSNPSLKWAWYILLVFILLFVIFNGKRKLGIIPVLAARKNTSLEHIQLISELYQQKNNHYAISAKVFGNFLSYLRNELRISTIQKSDKIVDEVLMKTSLERSELESIFNKWKAIEANKMVRTEMFLAFNDEINTILKRLKR